MIRVITDRYGVACDRPECEATVEGVGNSSRDQIRDAVDFAERKGWQIGPHGVAVELCPMHIEPSLPHKLPITRLFDCYGQALPRPRRA
jgi:hypothetical protein